MVEGRFDGIGFVFTEHDDIVGIDIDRCISDGKFETLAYRLMERFDSYTEIRRKSHHSSAENVQKTFAHPKKVVILHTRAR